MTGTRCIRARLTGTGSIVVTVIPWEGPPDEKPLEFCNLDALIKDVADKAKQVRRRKASNDVLKSLGKQLFAKLFPNDLGFTLAKIIGEIEANTEVGTYLQIELVIDEASRPDIAGLPWELLCMPVPNGGERWLGRHPRIALIRRTAVLEPRKLLLIDRPLKVLLVISAPKKDERIGPVASEDVRQLLTALAAEDSPLIALVEPLEQPTLTTLREALETSRPDIVHFIGHGRLHKTRAREGYVEDGQVALFNQHTHGADWKSADLFAEIFQVAIPALVVLQSCESGAGSASTPFASVAAQLIAQDVRVVVAMQHAITNNAASFFAEHFYKQIAANLPIDRAVQDAVGLC